MLVNTTTSTNSSYNQPSSGGMYGNPGGMFGNQGGIYRNQGGMYGNSGGMYGNQGFNQGGYNQPPFGGGYNNSYYPPPQRPGMGAGALIGGVALAGTAGYLLGAANTGCLLKPFYFILFY